MLTFRSKDFPSRLKSYESRSHFGLNAEQILAFCANLPFDLKAVLILDFTKLEIVPSNLEIVYAMTNDQPCKRES